VQISETIEFIGRYDQESAARLKRLLDRKPSLREENVYGEAFTERQFALVFTPLVEKAFARAKILELLGRSEGRVRSIAGTLNLSPETTFRHIKELMRRNLVEIIRFEEREPVFGRKAARGAREGNEQ
jgi:DNA-binding MarR family transcriptional regulator